MKLIAEIAGEQLTLDAQRDGARVVATIDGRRYELEAFDLEQGNCLLIVDNQVYECRFEQTTAEPGATDIYVQGQTYNVSIVDPRRLRNSSSGGGRASHAASGQRAKVTAMMPGKVVRVLVEAGAQVAAGDGLVVVEAMKMQNEIKSPKTGTVIELRAQAGATVKAGDILVIIE